MSDGPGLMLIGDNLEVLTLTPSAERWLEELRDGSPGLPNAIRSVLGALREIAPDDPARDLTPRVRVRGASGRRLVIHGSQTREADGRPASAAVIIEEAKPSEIAPIIVRAYGLSDQEANITRLILQGLSTKEITPELYVSPYTVQDHLKSIFEKVGVRSRRELVARILDQHHGPRYGHGENPPGSDGALTALSRPSDSAHPATAEP